MDLSEYRRCPRETRVPDDVIGVHRVVAGVGGLYCKTDKGVEKKGFKAYLEVHGQL